MPAPPPHLQRAHVSMEDGSPPEASPLEPPCRFGDYVLLDALGQGGMGEVFLAKAEGIAGIEKRCVVKTLRAAVRLDREHVARFIDEARVVVQLQHKNVCPVFDVGVVDQTYYLAMEHVRGRDLRTTTRRAEQRAAPMPAPIALHVACEVLDALDYAHRLVDPTTGAPLCLVHRDVSPQNVMLSFEGEVKLIDFGLAQSALKVERTAPDVVLGKIAYMSPEQATARGVDARTDQFAAAVIAYELLAGERYYEGLSPQAIWEAVGDGRHVPRRLAALPAELAAILRRGLHADPAQRFPTCADARRALVAYARTQGLVVGAEELRAWLAQVCPGEEDRDRARLAGALQRATAVPSPAAEQTSRHLVRAGALSSPDEPTVSRTAQRPSGSSPSPPPPARASSSPSQPPAVTPPPAPHPRGAAAHEPTTSRTVRVPRSPSLDLESTTRFAPPPSGLRRGAPTWVVAAALAATVGVAGALVLATSRGGAPAGAVAPAAFAARASVAAGSSAPATTSSSAAAGGTDAAAATAPAATSAGAAATSTAPAATSAGAAAPSNSPAATSAGAAATNTVPAATAAPAGAGAAGAAATTIGPAATSAPAGASAAGAAATSNEPTTTSAPAARKPRKRPRRAIAAMSLDEKLDALGACAKTCAAPLTKQGRHYGTMSVADAQQWIDDANRCLASCD